MPNYCEKLSLFLIPTPVLWRSAQRGDLDELRKHISGFAEVLVSEPWALQKALNCALQIAVWNEHTASVALLLECGADPNARIRDECTLFTLTGRHLRRETICLLAQYGARCTHGDYLELADCETNASVCALVQTKVNVDGNSVFRPLMVNCRRKPLNIAVITALIRCKADVNKTEAPFKTTALHALCRQPHRRHVCRVLKMLLDAKADLNASAGGVTAPRLILDRALSMCLCYSPLSTLQRARIAAAQSLLVAAETKHLSAVESSAQLVA